MSWNFLRSDEGGIVWKQSADPETSETSKELHGPVYFISDELYEFAAALELAASERKDKDRVQASALPDVWEPDRRLNHFAPPRRPRGTFWRSMARRILELSSVQTK